MTSVDMKTLSEKERHDYLLKTYILNQRSNNEQNHHKRDIDIIREHHRFLWDDDDNEADSWELRLVRRYYDKLFKEYCVADLSRYKENKIALRWRTEAEVIHGKGQFQCGSIECNGSDNLRSWEVNFAYMENGQRKNALVKLRLCPGHSIQLNYTSKKRELKRLNNQGNQHHKRKKTKESSSRKADTDNKKLLADITTIEVGDSINASDVVVDDEVDNTEHAVWNRKLDLETEALARETKFERYLQDLLL